MSNPLMDDLARVMRQAVVESWSQEERMFNLAHGIVLLHAGLLDADPRSEVTQSTRAVLAECERNRWTLEWAQELLASSG